MGFTKRYFSKKLILTQIKLGFPLHKYFNVDAMIFDDQESQEAYKLFTEGKTDQDIKEFLLKEDTNLIQEN